MRERLKEENAMKAEFKKSIEEERRKRRQQEALQAKQEMKSAEEERAREQARLKQLHDWKEGREKLAQLRLADELRYHEEKIRSLVDRKEYLECLRREEEEQRMRYLEGRRKLIEDRILSQQAHEALSPTPYSS
jgi:hypothetical protein